MIPPQFLKISQLSLRTGFPFEIYGYGTGIPPTKHILSYVKLKIYVKWFPLCRLYYLSGVLVETLNNSFCGLFFSIHLES